MTTQKTRGELLDRVARAIHEKDPAPRFAFDAISASVRDGYYAQARAAIEASGDLGAQCLRHQDEITKLRDVILAVYQAAHWTDPGEYWAIWQKEIDLMEGVNTKTTIDEVALAAAHAEGRAQGYAEGLKVGRYEAFEVATDEVRLYAQRLAARLGSNIPADEPITRAQAPNGLIDP